MRNDRVSLLIAGRAHSDWERYEIDSDLMIPADAWSVSIGMSGGQVPPDVVGGASVVVKVGDDTALTGYVDEISHSVSKTAHSLTMYDEWTRPCGRPAGLFCASLYQDAS